MARQFNRWTSMALVAVVSSALVDPALAERGGKRGGNKSGSSVHQTKAMAPRPSSPSTYSSPVARRTP